MVARPGKVFKLSQDGTPHFKLKWLASKTEYDSEIRALKLMAGSDAVRALAPRIVLQRPEHLQLVTEWCRHTLWTTGLRPDDLPVVCEQMCRALKFLHDNSIAHMDVSPYNILVRGEGAYVLNDMGLSMPLQAS